MIETNIANRYCKLKISDMIHIPYLIKMSRFDITNFLLPAGPFGIMGPLLSPRRAIVNIAGFSFVFVMFVLY